MSWVSKWLTIIVVSVLSVGGTACSSTDTASPTVEDEPTTTRITLAPPTTRRQRTSPIPVAPTIPPPPTTTTEAGPPIEGPWPGRLADIEEALTRRWSDEDLGNSARARCNGPARTLRIGVTVTCQVDVPVLSDTVIYQLRLLGDGSWVEEGRTFRSEHR